MAEITPREAAVSRLARTISRSRLLAFLTDVPVYVMALGILVLLGRGFAVRVGYPYDLEWMEGGMLAQALHISRGGGVYVEPSVEYVPFIYPPLYAWVLAWLGKLFGLGYALGRSISMVGTLLAAGALVAALRVEGRGWALGVGAAALYLTGYDDSGSFYDLVRIDGLFMAFFAWALVSVRAGWLRTGGLLLVLAFATKHNAALFGLPALVWLLKVRGRSDALRFLAWSVLPAVAFMVGMLFEGDGLFLTYLLGVPSQHPFVAQRLFPGAPKEMLFSMPWTIGVAVLVGVVWVRRWTAGGAYWVAQGALAIVLSAVMRSHHGGYLNVLMPGLWAVSLWSALALGAVRARWPHLVLRAAVGALLAFQIWSGRWDQDRYLPTEQDRVAGDELIALIEQMDGEVLSPWAPWYPVLAGKAPTFHLIALWDIDHEGGPLQSHVGVVRQSFKDRRWAAVIAANDNLTHGLKQYYDREETLRWPGKALYPKTGWRVRPRLIFVPREETNER